ncbi:hypothetical protein GCM10023321_16600 [Pseudonocardia eucalypti]|uniref:Histidine kinase domain-containing protein n=1 Tax=Pseudonocardia eucalypti TaxID=648755 RepID=A0ABP9PS60_9PSEU|nr:signal transduction histidine kinase [Pseudonocardia eucalypti]
MTIRRLSPAGGASAPARPPGAAALPPEPNPLLARAAAAGYAVLLAMCVVVSLGWLAVGAAVAVAAHFPGAAEALTDLAGGGAGWARGLLAAVPRGEPAGQAVLDYLLSLVNLVLAGLLLFMGPRGWVQQLLALAMIGSAGAFNLQAHATTVAVRDATGFDVGGLHQVFLHGVAGAAYLIALLLVPVGRLGRTAASGTLGRGALAASGAAALGVIGFGTALLPHTLSCILFLGFGVPMVGLAVLPYRISRGPTAELRTQARLLFAALLAAVGTGAVLVVLTLLLWYLDQPGLMLVDPTAHSVSANQPPTAQPTALLFWFSRLAAAGVAVSVLVAVRRDRPHSAERAFSRGLASVMVVVLVGGGFVVIHAIVGWLPDANSEAGSIAAAAVATAVAAVAFLPVYLRAERLVDRLLYGERPTPYRVLADVAALSRTSSSDGPDLAGLAEAIGRGLSARYCQLTVLRPGLRSRTYTWSGEIDRASDESLAASLVTLPIRQGQEQIGAIAVDRGAVAGLHNERRTLLHDVADSLGAVLQASRLGIELERQLRAALAHAEDIAASRRQAVAEMDSERRGIERDLHDGAQHHLVTLRLALGLVEHEVSTGALAQARDRFDQLIKQVDEAEAVLARTAAGVSSIALTERGLAEALRAAFATDAGAEQPVAVQIDEFLATHRFAEDLESAVYFCCLEAVNNARKHAPGATITVRVGAEPGRLRFSVRDDGPGFDPAGTLDAIGAPGRGMRNVRTRIISVGGQITVDSTPGAGTTISGWVPLPADQPLRRTAPLTEPVPVPPSGTLPLLEAATMPGRLIRPGIAVPAPAPPGPATSAPAALPPAAPAPAAPAPAALAPSAPAPAALAPAAPAPADLPPLTRPVIRPRHPEGAPSRATALPLDPESLLGQARELLLAAAERHPDGAARDRIDQLTAELGEPPHLAVHGAPGAGRTTLAEALRTLPGGERFELVDPGPAGPAPVATLWLLRGPTDPPPQPGDEPVVGLLTRADESADGATYALELANALAEEYREHAQLGRHCQTVLPIAALLAVAAAALTEERFAALRDLASRNSADPPADTSATPPPEVPAAPSPAPPADPLPGPSADVSDTPPPEVPAAPPPAPPADPPPGPSADVSAAPPVDMSAGPSAAVAPEPPAELELVGWLGRFGVRAAVALIRDGTVDDADHLARELVERSGLPRLVELLTWRYARPAEARKVRAAMRCVAELSTEPDTDDLRYRLDRLRANAHELAEIDLAESLCAEAPPLDGPDRRLAERLLGWTGNSPAIRLGLAEDADREQIRAAAADQLAHWQRLAAHPVSTSARRDAAAVLARTCEDLLNQETPEATVTRTMASGPPS